MKRQKITIKDFLCIAASRLLPAILIHTLVTTETGESLNRADLQLEPELFKRERVSCVGTDAAVEEEFHLLS